MIRGFGVFQSNAFMCSEISEGNTLRSEEEEEGEEDDDTVTQCYTPASEQHVRFRD